MAEQAKAERDQDSSKLWNNARFSDLLIKFSGREVKAHRLILCQASNYFDKLCGPESQFAEANQSEIELLDDDPDAVEAMLRHLYNFWLKAPKPSLEILDKVRYYCNVVAISDKYGLPQLAQEALKGLNIFITSLEDPKLLLQSLTILTKEYNDYSLLDECATALGRPRLKELSAVAGFPSWLMSRPLLLAGLVEDATLFRSLKAVSKFQCHFCQNVLQANPGQPKCCRNTAGGIGFAFIKHS